MLRYITNKPKLDVTEGSVDAGYGTTAHGDPNSNVTAVLNLPLIEDTLAVRGVIYNDRHGGYINNVPSTFSRSPTDLGIARYNGGVVPTNSQSINNNSLVGNAINPLTYTGLRCRALYKINSDWNALLTQSYQNMDAEGVFYEMPYGAEGARCSPLTRLRRIGGQPLPPLSVTLFNPSYNKDKFENTALVVNGKIGDSQAGLQRRLPGAQRQISCRTTPTMHAACAPTIINARATRRIPPPASATRRARPGRNRRQTPTRAMNCALSTPDDKRIRGLVGAYWEDYNDHRPDPLEVRNGSDLLADRAQRQLFSAPSAVAGFATLQPNPSQRLLRRRGARLSCSWRSSRRSISM